MGYKIVYGSEGTEGRKQRFWSGRMPLLTALCFLLFVLSVSMIFEDRFIRLRAALLPATMDGSAAFGALVVNLKNDVPLKDAVTAFCREVISNAGIQ